MDMKLALVVDDAIVARARTVLATTRQMTLEEWLVRKVLEVEKGYDFVMNRPVGERKNYWERLRDEKVRLG